MYFNFFFALEDYAGYIRCLDPRSTWCLIYRPLK